MERLLGEFQQEYERAQTEAADGEALWRRERQGLREQVPPPPHALEHA